MRKTTKLNDGQKCEIVVELLAGKHSTEEIGRRWGITPAEVAEMMNLGLGLGAAIAGARNGNGSSSDELVRGTRTNPFEMMFGRTW